VDEIRTMQQKIAQDVINLHITEDLDILEAELGQIRTDLLKLEEMILDLPKP
jgi:hypothetical protein